VIPDLRSAVIDLIGGGSESLWSQLQRSAAHEGPSHGRPAARSRVPISLSVVSLVIEVTNATGEAAQEYGRRSYDVPADLTTILLGMIRTPDRDVCDWWTDQCRDWLVRAQVALGLAPPGTRWIRGADCPRCDSRWATATVDRETVRTPALAVVWATEPTGWRVDSIHCRACAASWTRQDGELAGLAVSLLTHLERGLANVG
jgi:hypothetical protein